MTESKREDHFGIAVLLIYFFTKDFLVLHFVKTIDSNNIINIQLK